MRNHRLILGLLALLIACQPAEKSIPVMETIDVKNLLGENPWPEIRKKRINQLLP